MAKNQNKAGLDKMKFEVAREMGVDLKQGYNGNLTSAQAGTVGGNMVKKLIEKGEQSLSN
jgi:predicted small acid-soluble spore protein